MFVRIYLLNLQELKNPERMEAFLKTVPLRVDEERRRKAEKIRNPRGRAVSLGAGLLLQKAVADAGLTGTRMSNGGLAGAKVTDGDSSVGGTEIIRISAGALLYQSGEPICLEYRYGEMGKPYLVNVPLYYNLSHSGDFVLCAVSEQEIGADIQEIRRGDVMRVAERYFAEEELEKLQECHTEAEKSQFLFQLWTKKEAFGKLTGKGIAEVISENMLCRADIEWLPFHAPGGYAAAVCKKN